MDAGYLFLGQGKHMSRDFCFCDNTSAQIVLAKGLSISIMPAVIEDTGHQGEVASLF